MIFGLVCFGTLFAGAITNHETLVLIHLVMYILVMIIDVIYIILKAVIIATLLPALLDCKDLDMDDGEWTLEAWDMDCEEYRKLVTISTIIGGILVLALNIYFWLCSLSFYLELKNKDGNPV